MSDEASAALDRDTAGLDADDAEVFRLLVDSVVDYAIFLLDPDGVVRSWNAGAERLKGYRADEVIGQHYSLFYPEDLRRDGLPDQLLERARREGRAEHSGWRVRQDGSRFRADVVITALHQPDGTLTGFAKVTRDVTDAHAAREARQEALTEYLRSVERLEQLDQWRREFIAAIVHDLRNPVVAIRAYAQLLLDEPVTDDDRLDLAQRVLSNVEGLQDLIDHLLTYAKLEAGRIALEPERLDLAELIDQLIADVGPLLQGHRLTVAVDPIEVSADRRGLRRVLRNLLANAVDHTPAGTHVSVTACTGNDHVVVEVADDGPGIPADRLERVFDRFEHASSGGTGLGLSIVRHYVELHGGDVTVDSASGQGTTFRFTLPLDQAQG